MTNNLTSRYLFISIAFFLSSFICTAQWEQKGSDISGNEASSIGFCISLNADGSKIVIGSPNDDSNGSNSGQVQVFSFNGTDWVQMGADINGSGFNEKLGHGVAITPNGNRIAFGTTFITTANGNFTGQVTIMEWNGSTWEMVGSTIDGLFNGDNFGWTVSISNDGNRVAVSAPLAGPAGTHLGEVSIFEFNGSNWVQMGTAITGQGTDDYLGFSLKLSGDGTRIAVGSHLNDNVATDAGNVRIFQWDGTDWQQMGSDLTGTEETDWFGYSLGFSEDGNRVAASAWHHGNDRGEIRAYDWDGNSWVQKGQSIVGENDFDNGGWSMALSADGETIVMGSVQNPGGGEYRGHARIFKLVDNTWLQVDSDIQGSMDFEFFGYYTSLSADGETVAISSPLASASNTNSGVVRVYEGGVLGTNTSEIANSFVAFPIPAENSITISSKNNYSQIEVIQYDMLGRNLGSKKFQNSNQVYFPLFGNVGTYLLTIKADGNIETIQILKN
ncbi:T9SS type A sorting domain-containing protein [Aequorivita echinoideorum]|uniref:T9SS type A sorting domain-containing protein n=1 Tax=Aequorivita echinoideorum TaxID=1549647 RepID=A0ABS5S124_9FLAO|nr:T9SS type A sorting domain-containing protein [Aequorivita echinoideorum]MBT0606678.1 T9SS type A sorting domain-containing protein [Aequorivita echinoideorum]